MQMYFCAKYVSVCSVVSLHSDCEIELMCCGKEIYVRASLARHHRHTQNTARHRLAAELLRNCSGVSNYTHVVFS